MYGSNKAFSYYDGGGKVHKGGCKGQIDHAVTLVGYGKRFNIPVWIIKNSWGPTWGDQGFFFIERGTNAYCIESSAFTFLPNDYEKLSALTHTNTTRTQTYQLDPDGTTVEVNGDPYFDMGDSAGSFSTGAIVGICIAALAVAAIGAGVYFCQKCKKSSSSNVSFSQNMVVQRTI